MPKTEKVAPGRKRLRCKGLTAKQKRFAVAQQLFDKYNHPWDGPRIIDYNRQSVDFNLFAKFTQELCSKISAIDELDELEKWEFYHLLLGNALESIRKYADFNLKG